MGTVPLRATWASFRAMLKQQFLLLSRYPLNLLANFFLVLASVIIIMLVMTLFAPEAVSQRLRGITLYGFVIYLFLSHTLWTVGMSLERETAEGTLTGLYLSPASRFLTLLARAVAALTWTAVAGLAGLLLAQTITGRLPVHQPGLALVILLFTVSGLIGLGFAIAGLALRFGQAVELAANLLEFGLMGLCAFFFPFGLLPPALQYLARLIPLSYSVDAFRTVALGEPRPELLSLEAELVIIIVTGLAGPPLGYGIYWLNERVARREGLL